MAWNKFSLVFTLIFLTVAAWAQELPKLLTKHPVDAIRFLTQDGSIAYVKKRPGILGMVSNFRTIDFLSEPNQNDFLVTGSRFRQKLIIEIIPNMHTEMSLMKNHKILTVEWGQSAVKEVGQGRHPKLHLMDEWISYFDHLNRTLILKNLRTEKVFEIKPSQRRNVFFAPEVEMVTADTVVYTEVNDSGIAAVIQYNLQTRQNAILYRTPHTGSRLELCQAPGYLAIGEFPYDGIERGSKIMQIKVTGANNLAGHSTLYTSVNEDIGNMVCLPDSIYFVKTLGHNKSENTKVTEAAQLTLKTEKVTIKSSLQNVNQLLNIDGRVMIPYRGELYVLEGIANLSEDVLKAVPKRKESSFDL
jgi:hypothetical protein